MRVWLFITCFNGRALALGCESTWPAATGGPARDIAGEWEPEGDELVPDGGLSPAHLDQLDGVLTGSRRA